MQADSYVSIWATAGNPSKLPEKHSVELIYAVAKEWNIKPEEIAVVGDTSADMKFANQGGAISIGVLSGTGKKDEMENCSQHLILSVATLLELMGQINGRAS